MAFSWSPVETLKGWGDALSSPFGIILLVLVAIYIYLRVTGRIDGINIGRGKGGNNSGGSFGRKPDYILK